MRIALTMALMGVWTIGCAPEATPSLPVPIDPAEPVWLPEDAVSAIFQAGQIAYQADPPGADQWQTPAETEQRGRGDCEDICIYLQHLLARQGIPADVVFGLRYAGAPNGHAWIELDQDGSDIIVEPRTGACYRRASLSEAFYIPAEEIDVVAQKVEAYHARTGVWVSRQYTPSASGE